MDGDDGWTEELPWLGQYILDDEGNPVPAKGLLSWARWFEDHSKERILARDTVGEAEVSTIFLGLDYGSIFLRDLQGTAAFPKELADAYQPKLWETMVFGGKYNHYQTRYTSKESALEGHQKIMLMVGADNN